MVTICTSGPEFDRSRGSRSDGKIQGTTRRILKVVVVKGLNGLISKLKKLKVKKLRNQLSISKGK